jgi:glycerophosphoryl diester phosphodiesterase
MTARAEPTTIRASALLDFEASGFGREIQRDTASEQGRNAAEGTRPGSMRALGQARQAVVGALVATAALALTGLAGAFDLQGHRGARGLAPENTLAAFRTAISLGVDTLELDTGVTKDGVLVVAHDPRLNPNFTRDATGQWIATPGPALNTLTLAELRRFDVGRLKPGTAYANGLAEQRAVDGEAIPTLAALFEQVKAWGAHQVRFNIETKLTPAEPALTPEPEAFARLLVDTVRRFGLEARVTVQSFDWRTLREVQRLAPQIPTVALTVQSPNFDNLADGRWTAGLQLADHGGSVPRLVKAAGAAVWSPQFNNLTPASLKEAQSLGLQVVPWTVNDPEAIERLIDWGVDGLISDYPDRVRAVMQRRGMALPAAQPVSRVRPTQPPS